MEWLFKGYPLTTNGQWVFYFKRKEEGVTTKTIEINNPNGIHLRTAAKLVEIAKGNGCRIDFSIMDRKASATSVLDLLTLEATFKSSLTVTAEGPNEEKALKEVELLLRDETAA